MYKGKSRILFRVVPTRTISFVGDSQAVRVRLRHIGLTLGGEDSHNKMVFSDATI